MSTCVLGFVVLGAAANATAAPGAFSKTSPANGATGVSRTPTVTWQASSGALGYEVCAHTSTPCPIDAWTPVGNVTSVTWPGAPLAAGETYHWHVRATNATGTTYANGSSAAYWSLTTVPPAPGAFNKTDPANGTTLVSTSPTLYWGSSAGAGSYEYCYDTTNDNTCSTWTSVGQNTNVALSALSYATAYYWQVRATNAGGTAYANGGATAFWSFMTGPPPPGAFSKSAPANAAVGVSNSPTLTWGASSNASSYWYCYDTTNDNACSPFTNAGATTSVGLIGLTPGTNYYWQVRAENTSGVAWANGNSTAYFTFTTLPNPPGAFTKSAPANGATNVSTSPALSWATSGNATSYEYCYDTTNDNACSGWVNAGTNTSAGLNGLANSTTYYWHVRAVNLAATVYANGSATAFWSFTTVPLPPGAFNKTSPVYGATGVSRSPTLTWGTSSAATSYEYCIDTDSFYSCAAWTSTETATSVTLTDLAYGTTYYWHVRANNGGGTTYSNGDYAYTFMFTTVPQPPGAFGKTQPLNGATDVSLSPTLRLIWGASSNAANYEYCYDTTNDNACTSWTSVLGQAADLSALDYGTTYYWQVRAVNVAGTIYANESATAYWSFRTVPPPPGAFDKTGPVNGATNVSRTPTLTWGASAHATSYAYCYDTSNDNSCSEWMSTGSATSAVLGGLGTGATYYWQVRASNASGTVYANGSTTAFWNFAVPSPPGGFGKASPANGATEVSRNPYLSWSSSTGATSYEYCIDASNDDACDYSWQDVGASTSVPAGSLPAAETFYWQVRAKNAAGTTEANSGSWWDFTTATPPASFGKSSPSNGATGLATHPTLGWETSSGAERYEYCYDLTNDGACNVWTSVGGSTSVAVGTVPAGETLYWQVRAVSENGTTYANGSAAACWSFTTATAPAAFSKVSPPGGAVGASRYPRLSWEGSGGADSYEYCYDTINDNACTSWQSTGSATSVVIEGLAYGTTYYWQVRAVSAAATTYANGSAAAFWNFTTVVALPGDFGKLMPEHGAVNVPVETALAWRSSTDATSYEYCYDTTNDNACSPWVSISAGAAASLSGLTPGATYYWQVRAINATGATYANGSQTAYFSFTTVPAPGAFGKSSPGNGATGVSRSAVLSWGWSDGATSYSYCYDTTNDNGCSNWTSAESGMFAVLSGLAPGTTYYWQASASNDAGTTYADGGATAFRSFTTEQEGEGFSKRTPVDGATSVPRSPLLRWAASPGAAGYHYCYDTTNDNACSNWTSAAGNTSALVSGLAAGTKYYWQVAASYSAGYTIYADGATFHSFTTAPEGEGFSKTAPANGATSVSRSPLLRWGASPGAAGYAYCYDTTDDDACRNWTSAGGNTSALVSGLAAGTTHYWQVAASYSEGYTIYADGATFHSFTTAPEGEGFSKVTPVNGASTVPRSLTLSWGASPGAASYHYCFDTTNDNACSNWTNAVQQTNALVSGLTAGTTYYWQVAASYSEGYTIYADGGTFHSFTTTARATPADFTADMKSDILWRHGSGGDVWLWTMDGADRLAEDYVRTVADTNWEIRGLGDQTGDGKADILWRNNTSWQVYLWPMNGSTPLDETYVGTVDTAYDIVGTGDFNGDGTSDILWRHATLGDVWIWLMDGATPLSEVYVDRVDPGYVVKGLGDLDGDGKADIVWHGAAGDVWVWPMNGTTRLDQVWVGSVSDTGYQIQRVADVTGDGKADLVWWHGTRGEVWLWTMNGTVRQAETWVASVPDPAYRIVGAGDYDGDGKADLLWHHATRGEVWVWLMNGTTRVSETWVGTVPDTGYQISK